MTAEVLSGGFSREYERRSAVTTHRLARRADCHERLLCAAPIAGSARRHGCVRLRDGNPTGSGEQDCQMFAIHLWVGTHFIR